MNKPFVMVVDDNPVTRNTLEQGLNQRGLAVHTVGSAEEALSKLKDGFIPAVIILDLQLPGMSGADLTRIIKSNENWEGISMVPFSTLVNKDQGLGQPIVQDFIVARSGKRDPSSVMTGKGPDDTVKDFPRHLLPPLVRALKRQNIPVPPPVLKELRDYLENQQ